MSCAHRSKLLIACDYYLIMRERGGSAQMSILESYRRVTFSEPCLVCKKPDWCLVARDGSGWICARVASHRRIGSAGWFHRVAGPKADYDINRVPRSAFTDFEKLAEECEHRLSFHERRRFANSLGVSESSLLAMQVGRMKSPDAYTFPMRDASDRVIGIRLRLMNGKKLSVRGGREGCFIPRGAIGDETTEVIICEGPTDTAAILSSGYPAIGRPSCRGGKDILLQILRKRDAVIFADDDGPGLSGANDLAESLVRNRSAVRICCAPRGKDVREWSPSYAEVRTVISCASYWSKK